jgi:hypothetical protein
MVTLLKTRRHREESVVDWIISVSVSVCGDRSLLRMTSEFLLPDGDIIDAGAGRLRGCDRRRGTYSLSCRADADDLVLWC